MQEPVLTWNLFITAVLVPASLWFTYLGITRQLNKKDKEEDRKSLRIEKLLQDREMMKDKQDEFAHTLINNKLEVLHQEITTECIVSKEARDEIFDKLSTIDITLKLINGSVRDTKAGLEIHKAGHHEK